MRDLRAGCVKPDVESAENPSRYSRRRSPIARANQITLAPAAVRALTSEHGRFLRFIRSRLGADGEAEDLLQDSLLRALQRGDELRRGERVVAWFYRILRNAISDHYREKKFEDAALEQFVAEIHSWNGNGGGPGADWEAVVCACFRGLLPTLKPRYAEVLRRVDLQGESKAKVARALKIRGATMDVVLHRARRALRKRLEIFCGACSRERCLACACAVRGSGRREKV